MAYLMGFMSDEERLAPVAEPVPVDVPRRVDDGGRGGMSLLLGPLFCGERSGLMGPFAAELFLTG